MVVQRPRQMDHDSREQSAIEFPKMRAISRDKGIAVNRSRCGENKPILLWKAVDFGPSGRRSDRRHPHAEHEPVKVRQMPRCLGHDGAAGFIDDISIHPTLASALMPRAFRMPRGSVTTPRLVTVMVAFIEAE